MGDMEWSFAESRFEMRYNIAMRLKCSAHSQHRSSVGEWGAHNPCWTGGVVQEGVRCAEACTRAIPADMQWYSISMQEYSVV